MIRLLRRPNVVGISLVRDKVYLTQPDVKIMSSGVEYEVIGTPVLTPAVSDIIDVSDKASQLPPSYIMPAGCSPNFGKDGGYYTANHCVSGDKVVMVDKDLNKIGEANVVKRHKWRPFGFFCIVMSLITGKIQCVNEDLAVIDSGNSGDIPIGVLSGGTVPPGVTFIAPLTPKPEDYIGEKITGVTFDYDAKDYHVCVCDVFDYGIVKYMIDNKPYLVKVWYARGQSKPGFSVTNIYTLHNAV